VIAAVVCYTRSTQELTTPCSDHPICPTLPPPQILPLSSVLQVPVGDNYFAALNSAVFSDGSFVYVPKGVKSPMELSTYFRINASETGQVSALRGEERGEA